MGANGGAIRKLKIAPKAAERAVLGVSRRHPISNDEISRDAGADARTKVSDTARRITSLQWQRAGHLARRTDDRQGQNTSRLASTDQKTSNKIE